MRELLAIAKFLVSTAKKDDGGDDRCHGARRQWHKGSIADEVKPSEAELDGAADAAVVQ